MSKTLFVPAASFQATTEQSGMLRDALDAGAQVVVAEPDGQRVLSSELAQFLDLAVSEIASGGEVLLVRGESEASPAEAGELLGVSRQFVDRLIDVGKIPSRRLPGSRHRRVRVADVLAFGRQREERRTQISDGVNGLVDAGANY